MIDDANPFAGLPPPKSRGASSASDADPFQDVRPGAREVAGSPSAVSPVDAAARAAEDDRYSWAGPAAPALRSFTAANPAAHMPLGISHAADRLAAAAHAAIGRGEGDTFGDRYSSLTKWSDAQKRAMDLAHPTASTVGDVVTIPVSPGLGASKLGPALGNIVSGSRLGPGAISSATKLAGDVTGVAGLGAAYAGARGLEEGLKKGDNWQDSIRGGLAGAVEGATATVPIPGTDYRAPLAVAIPLAGRAIGAVASRTPGIKQYTTGTPEERVVGAALGADAKQKAELLAKGKPTTAAGLSEAEMADARAAGQPVVLADTGGEKTRSLARSVRDVSPEAAAELQSATMARSDSQAQRFKDFVSQKYGVAADPAVMRAKLEADVQASVAPAYKTLYASPQAQSVWSPRLDALSQSPAVQSAIADAVTMSRNASVVRGAAPPVSPFMKSNGMWVTSNAPGMKPSLELWDHVKQVLDQKVTSAYKSGLAGDATQLKNVRNALRDALDAEVKGYQAVRQGAAAHFDAENFYDAGQNFMKRLDAFKFADAKAALASASPQQRQLFSYSIASSIINDAANTGVGTSILKKYSSPAAREKLELGLGATTARDIEAYLQRERVMQFLKDRVSGGSNTSQNAAGMVGLGATVAGATGVSAYNNRDALLTNPATAGAHILGAAISAALLHSGHKQGAQAAPKIAELLTSTDPGALKKLSEVFRNDNIREASRAALMTLGARSVSSPATAPSEAPKGSPSALPPRPWFGPGKRPEDRPARASGGAVGFDHGAVADGLIRAAKQAKDALGQTTQHILKMPDESVARALGVANASI